MSILPHHIPKFRIISCLYFGLFHLLQLPSQCCLLESLLIKCLFFEGLLAHSFNSVHVQSVALLDPRRLDRCVLERVRYDYLGLGGASLNHQGTPSILAPLFVISDFLRDFLARQDLLDLLNM